MAIDTLTLIAFAGNVGIGALAVISTYVAMERSVAAGGVTALTMGIGALLIEHWLAARIVWPSMGTLQAASMASVAGAIVGVAMVILAFRPEMSPQTDSTRTSELESTED
jgi:hypothetical protein